MKFIIFHIRICGDDRLYRIPHNLCEMTEHKGSSLAVIGALVLLAGAVITEGILIVWMQQEINHIKTTINSYPPSTAYNRNTKAKEFSEEKVTSINQDNGIF